MQRFILILTIIIACSACHESFVPKLDSSASLLSIQGNIGTQARKYYVSVKRSAIKNNQTILEGEEGAEVYVEDQNGEIFYFQERGNGAYLLDASTSVPFRIGSTYILNVITTDGNEFISEPQKIDSCPPIDTLFCSYDTIATYYTDIDERIHTEDDVIMRIHFSTRGILPRNNNFIYKYRALEQHRSLIMQNAFIGRTALYYRRRIVDALPIANADVFMDYYIHKELFYISLEDMQNFIPAYDPLEETLSYTKFYGLVFELEQYSVSPDVYRFYTEAVEQMEATGSLTDPVAPKVHGNIHCVNNPDYSVLGVFYASDIKSRSAVLYIGRIFNTMMAEYTLPIDEFPVPVDQEPERDTVYNWIDIPI